MSDQPITTGHDDDALASEFVLGVLEGEERRRCMARMDSDPDFARRVAAWETRLSGLDTHYEEATPPAGAKAAIDARLFGARTAPARRGLWWNLGFWRGLSIASLAAVVALGLLLANGMIGQTSDAPRLVASLAAAESDARFIALLDGDTLDVTLVGGERPTDRDFELWLIVGDSAPRSLGLVREGTRPARAADLSEDLIEGVTLAVSLEPQGGSPEPVPTGPVVAVGQLKKI